METHREPGENPSHNLPPPPPPPLTPRSIPRSDGSPSATTFIEADSSSFKQVVQMLTGSAVTAAKTQIPPAARATAPKKPSFKLYERRGSLKHLNAIALAGAAGFAPPRKPAEISSPSSLGFPSLVLSPVTPLIADPFNRYHRNGGSPAATVAAAAVAAAAVSAEEKAIAEKGFYLHPSPRTAPPPLLPLFPTTSPRLSSAAAAPLPPSSFT